MIELDVRLMAVTFVSFAFSVGFLYMWFFKPLLGFMDEREAFLQKDANDIKDNEEQIAKIEEEISEILGAAKVEALRIRDRAVSDARIMYDKNISEVKLVSDRELREFKQRLARDKEAFKNSLSPHLISLKEDLKSRIIAMQTRGAEA